jgi:XTP/dITP diphosphohydrolase
MTPRSGGVRFSDLLIATTNAGKLAEIRRALEGLPIRLLTLTDLAPLPEPEETGATFAENARIKATTYAAAAGLPTVAEDSGLAIDALGGRPGVASARYPGATYPEKFTRLYAELAGTPRPWTARFVCAVALVDRREQVFACEGTVEGAIAEAPRGEHGFGYDPVFYYPPYGRTLAEVSRDRKLAVSHRGRAFRVLRAYLEHPPGRAETPA